LRPPTSPSSRPEAPTDPGVSTAPAPRAARLSLLLRLLVLGGAVLTTYLLTR
jgi:hypothetical protein